MDNASELLDLLQEMATVYGVKILAAIAIFFIGRIVAAWAKGLIEKMMRRGKTDEIIISFVGSISYMGLMAFVVIASLGQLGVATTSFIAVLGAAGLAVALALQGSLSNFAAGFLLIIFRPFKVGDYIEGAGVAGTVESIQVFTTTLKTADNKTIIVPNAKLSEDNIVNYSAKGTRRVDMVFGVSYEAGIKQVRQVLEDIVTKDERIFADPEPLIVVSELGDSSVSFTVRVWGNAEDYWGIYFDTTEAVKHRFDAEGIGMPYPQRDVHLFEHKAA